MKYFHDARDDFFDMRWGLWLHFVLYSIEGWHEQDQWRRRIPRAEYVKLVDRFNPTRDRGGHSSRSLEIREALSANPEPARRGAPRRSAGDPAGIR